MRPIHFLSDQTPLQSDHAAAAIIVANDGRYLLQLRDDIPRIFYPGHWGCFGGAIAPGETPLQAVTRELEEELQFNPSDAREFVRFDFDFTTIGQGPRYRAYYEYAIDASHVDDFVLCEGTDMRLFAPNDIFGLSNLIPYDSFAIWLHFARHRFAAGGKKT